MPKTKEEYERDVNERIALAHAPPKVRQTKAYRELQARVDAEEERAWLGASEIACAVADAWAAGLIDLTHTGRARTIEQRDAAEALDRLEAATRGSALRKVRP